jgi:hypothetical protein
MKYLLALFVIMEVHYQQLYFFTKLRVDSARRMAALGFKDEARDVARFVRNARIIDILRPYSGQLMIDAWLLDSLVTDLERECHPLTPAPYARDQFSQILSRLDLIAGLLNARADALSGQRTNSSGANNDVSGRCREDDTGWLPGMNQHATLKGSPALLRFEFSAGDSRLPVGIETSDDPKGKQL